MRENIVDAQQPPVSSFKMLYTATRSSRSRRARLYESRQAPLRRTPARQRRLVTRRRYAVAACSRRRLFYALSRRVRTTPHLRACYDAQRLHHLLSAAPAQPPRDGSVL